MASMLLKKVFGTRNQRVLKKLGKHVHKINACEPAIQALSDDALCAKTEEFKSRLKKGETLDAILPEAFAVVREASVRTLGLRHFDVQLIGGLVMHYGKVAEMCTGEGKTLMATLAAYLNALTDRGVHVITVNDYLAARDAAWMKPIYEFLGLRVGVVVSGMELPEKKDAYAADITYGTNNEFGFDYLRDNMAFSLEDRVQGELHYAIIDEVDSVLIDEARTPLIISGPTEDGSEVYLKLNTLVPNLTMQTEEEGPGDFSMDEKSRQVYLTEEGHQRVEALFLEAGLLKHGGSLYDVSNISLMHHLMAALRAHHLFHRDVDYISKDGEIVIVDEHTGRTMEGRRWSDGLHQAVEAKEGVSVRSENQTVASITFQNYFRMYETLAGMTGTADTEAFELQQIYGLEVVVIPTNRPLIRKDMPDQIFISAQEKFTAIVDDVKVRSQNGQPILLGTASIESSELLSRLLTNAGVAHQVLNAKFHEKEAHIIAQAGRAGAVTIATNMAGRGTDIVLGGSLDAELAECGDISDEEQKKRTDEWKVRHDNVIACGGLHVLGSERHESRRIDNQLRGRSGRQGDPGSSQFYLALDDNLMRIFASDRVAGIMKRLGMEEGEAIEHPLVTRAIEGAQRKVEGFNFDIRKQLLEFDDVANDQRTIIYAQRLELMKMENVGEAVAGMREQVAEETVARFMPPQSMPDVWDVAGLEHTLIQDFGLHLNLPEKTEGDEGFNEDSASVVLLEALNKNNQEKEAQAGREVMGELEKSVMLHHLDQHWKEHLAAMDHLRQGIGLRGYAQKNPVQEYKRESFELFAQMLSRIRYDTIGTLTLVELREQPDVVEHSEALRRSDVAALDYSHVEMNAMPSSPVRADDNTVVRIDSKIGRNQPCPCGSGKKYKHCHGTL